MTPPTFSLEKTCASNKEVIFRSTTLKAGLHFGLLVAKTVHLQAYADDLYASNNGLKFSSRLRHPDGIQEIQVPRLWILVEEVEAGCPINHGRRGVRVFGRTPRSLCRRLGPEDGTRKISGDTYVYGLQRTLRRSHLQRENYKTTTYCKECERTRVLSYFFKNGCVGLVNGNEKPAEDLAKVSCDNVLELILPSKRNLIEAAE